MKEQAKLELTREIVALHIMHKVADLPMRGATTDMLYFAREHYSEAKLAERESNRKAYFDTKYPDRRIFLVGE